MVIFGNDKNIRGCFMVYTYNGSASRGAVLKLPSGGIVPKAAFSDPILVVGFNATQRESVSFTKTFGGRVYTYAFGHDPNGSVLSVEFMSFLIDKTKYSQIVETMLQHYKKSRVSQSGAYAKFGLGHSTPLRGFVVGMGTATADPEVSLQRFTLDIALVEPQ